MLKSLALLGLLGVLGLASCTVSVGDPDSSELKAPPAPDTSPDASTHRPATPLSPEPTSPAPSATPDAATELAQAAFANTLASGVKKWELKNVNVSFERKSDDTTKRETWTAKCKANGPVKLTGAYPSVSVTVGGIDCEPAHKPREFIYLQLITFDMSFSAHHMPAGETEPNQFRLDLSSAARSGVFSWTKRASINASLREGRAFFDFIGDARGRGGLGFEEKETTYVTISISQNEARTTEKLEMNETHRATSDHESTEMSLTADLERVAF